MLSKEEILKIIDATENLKHKTVLALIYSAGLRISEALSIKSSDIDSVRMLIHIKEKRSLHPIIKKTFLLLRE